MNEWVIAGVVGMVVAGLSAATFQARNWLRSRNSKVKIETKA